jgi:predicted O-methyltransferase YrrM
MSNTLSAEPVAGVLDRLFTLAEQEDPLAKERVSKREAELGRRLDQIEKYEVYGDRPPLAISREVGQLLYVLALSRPLDQVVEFGASLGISTIHLAAAIRDKGQGSLITTEMLPTKAQATRANLAAAGLDDIVELRVGDAVQTLRDIEGSVDLLFLDGRNDLYLEILQLLQPHLSPGALVVADLSHDDPDLIPYLEHVRDPNGAYASVCLPLDAGVELSVQR